MLSANWTRLIGPVPPPGSIRNPHTKRTACNVLVSSDNAPQFAAVGNPLLSLHKNSAQEIDKLYHTLVHMPLLCRDNVNAVIDWVDLSDGDTFAAGLEEVLDEIEDATEGKEKFVPNLDEVFMVLRMAVARRHFYHDGRYHSLAPDDCVPGRFTSRDDAMTSLHVASAALPEDLEDVRLRIDTASESVQSCSGFFYFATKNEVHDVYTADALDAIASLITTQVEGASSTVLEVGAGKGRLSKGIRDRLPVASYNVIATDALPYAPNDVTASDYKTALQKHACSDPPLRGIICAWPPYMEGGNWVRYLQEHCPASVRLIVFLGPPQLVGTGEIPVALSEAPHGFRGEVREDIASHLVCRYDCDGDDRNAYVMTMTR